MIDATHEARYNNSLHQSGIRMLSISFRDRSKQKDIKAETFDLDPPLSGEGLAPNKSLDASGASGPCPKSRLGELVTEPVAIATGCFQRDYPLAAASGSVPGWLTDT